MGTKTAADIVRANLKRLYRHADDMKKGFEKDSIHDFRLDYKKTRALLRMLAPASKQPDEVKLPGSLKKMYLLAGDVRDRQLCLEKIKKAKTLKKSSALTKQLRSEINELSHHKELLYSKKDFPGLEKKLVKALPAIGWVQATKNFTDQKLNDMRVVLEKPAFNDTELHSVRKAIKDLTFGKEIFQDDLGFTPRFLPWRDEDFQRAKEFADLIGNYNDAAMALSFVPMVVIKKADDDEANPLRELRRLWQKEKRDLKGKIMQAIPGLRLR